MKHHIFDLPFYYIEYGISLVGALQLWQQYEKDPAAAMANYKKALALGGSRPLPELFAAAGLEFDMSGKMLHTLMQSVGTELDRLK